jgi:hypothetical protein
MPQLSSLKAKSMNAAKQAKYGPKEMTQGAVNARWVKLRNEVDPQSVLSEAERNRRAEALLKSRMLDLAARGVAKRQAAKAQKIDTQRYQQERHAAPHGCIQCDPTLPPGAIDVMCSTHLDEQLALMQRH